MNNFSKRHQSSQAGAMEHLINKMGSMRKLAEKLGVSYASVNLWANAVQKIPVDQAANIADIFKDKRLFLELRYDLKRFLDK